MRKGEVRRVPERERCGKVEKIWRRKSLQSWNSDTRRVRKAKQKKYNSSFHDTEMPF